MVAQEIWAQVSRDDTGGEENHSCPHLLRGKPCVIVLFASRVVEIVLRFQVEISSPGKFLLV